VGALNHNRSLIVRQLGVVEYGESYAAMRRYTDTDTYLKHDELWVLQHPPVFTLGVRGGSLPHEVDDDPIRIVQTNRGGLATYHGPGQVVIYPLVHLPSIGIGVRALVNTLEQCAIDVLATYAVHATRRMDAPGVYVAGDKIASVGLRVSRGIAYHGVSINVNMDLAPFARIDACGLGVTMTQLAAFAEADVDAVADHYVDRLTRALGYPAQRLTMRNHFAVTI
jgi:lipoyl(octanoyl) transferase